MILNLTNEETDTQSEVEIDDFVDPIDDTVCICTSIEAFDVQAATTVGINRAQAQQIVDHLTRVFALEKKA